jgi:hypothetical protein
MIVFGARGAATRAYFLQASFYRPEITAHKPILNWRYC